MSDEPVLNAPVTFTGADAEAFLAELPSELSPEAAEDLRASLRSAANRRADRLDFERWTPLATPAPRDTFRDSSDLFEFEDD